MHQAMVEGWGGREYHPYQFSITENTTIFGWEWNEIKNRLFKKQDLWIKKVIRGEIRCQSVI